MYFLILPPREVWHQDVRKFVLYGPGANVVGVLYLDALARPGKRMSSAQFTLRGSHPRPQPTPCWQ